MPHSNTVSVSIYVKAGSRYERYTEDGVFHFIEHMLFKGSEKRPKPELISGAIENVGGLLNASTDRELTVYWSQVPVNYWVQAIDVLCDMIKNPIFDLHEIASLLVDHALWPDQTIGRDVGGTQFSVNNLSSDQMIKSYNERYIPTNIVISVAGNVSSETVFDICNDFIGDWSGAVSDNWVPAMDFQNKPVVLNRNFPSEQSHVSLGLRGVSSEDSSRFAINLLSVILAGGMSSHLFLELREKRGLVYEISSSVLHLIDTGALYISMDLDKKNVLESINLIVEAMNNLKAQSFKKELERSKNYLQGRFMMRMESTLSVANWYGAQYVTHDRVISIDEIYQKMQSVTFSEIRDTASSIFVPEKTNLAIVGPEINNSDIAEIEQILLKL